MRIAFVATPVPAVPLSMIQREYYFYLFASRVMTVLGHLTEEDFRRFWMLEPVNLGLLQLIGYLEKQGIECSYFASITPEGEEKNREKVLLDKILEQASDFDVIGFTSITASYNTARQMASAVHEKHPEIPLVLGGNHGWIMPDDILKNSVFDYIVRKEGEETTLELLKVLEAGRSPEGIKGLSFNRDGKVIHNPDRLRMDRSNNPLPAYDHLEDNFTQEEMGGENIISIPISRVTPTVGCGNNCIWCADYWKPDLSIQTKERFTSEVSYLMEKRNSRYFYLGTHDFFRNIDLAMQISENMGSLAKTMRWEAQTRANESVTRSHLQRLVDSGCRCLHIGVESADQQLLQKMGKNINIPGVIRMLEMAREVGIYTHTYWLVGVPYETRETAKRTINTMRQWLDNDLSSSSELNILVGYPGTQFYDTKEKFNVTAVDPDFTHFDGRNVPTFDTTALTRRDVEYLYHLGLESYNEAMSGKIGTRKAVMAKLGGKYPNFDPAFMEAAF